VNLQTERTPLSYQPLILVVDDERTIRALLRAALEPAGFRVAEAGDAAGALRLARTGPDLVLLDIALPDASGLEVCRQLKAAPATTATPVLLLTGLAQAPERQAAREAGAAGCIAKPFRPSELISQIRDVLGRPAALPSR
jgi:DNA-binding response OmpR family regulator